MVRISNKCNGIIGADFFLLANKSIKNNLRKLRVRRVLMVGNRVE